MTSMRARYVLEREGIETLENDTGYIEFQHLDKIESIHIKDMYILKKYRKTGQGRKLYTDLMDIAEDRNCKYIIASYDENTSNWKNTKELLEYEDFKVIFIVDKYVTMEKEL
jgi:GNAT superfamily N-acetyltransferase